MTKVTVKHLGDNYYEVAYAISAVIDLHKTLVLKNEQIVSDIISEQIFDYDPETNQALESQLSIYLEDNVERLSSYSFILLICAGFEEAIRLLQNDEKIATKSSKSKYGDYLKNIALVPQIDEAIYQDINDLFDLRHWIIHRNGRKNIQKLSESEYDLLRRISRHIKIRNTYLKVNYEYILSIAIKIQDFLKKVAVIAYE